ncbi:MAG: Lrp/AsnC ligand binding domain-containing protein [Bacteroidales bacterium]|jgi:Lrp/AsnC family transcriptional regulator for asnA, asnC and gidA|nr:Lrp/AsnC ligand binding domain-containing protein [Bacteroidales bacterium]MCR5696032.1 Lrp/AsnC ligand binding domain-containing protein [Marinilabiliaceae bacterium]
MAENRNFDVDLQIDDLDKKILSLIMENARMPFLEVARACGVSGAAIHQRVQRLVNIGVIKGSEFIINPSKIGYMTCAYIGIFLKDASYFDSVVDQMKKIPQIVECHYTTGQYAIFIKVYAKSNEHMKFILHDCLQQIEGISATETIISLEESFKRQISIDDKIKDLSEKPSIAMD